MSYFINPVYSVGLRTLIYCYMTSLLRGFSFSRQLDETHTHKNPEFLSSLIPTIQNFTYFVMIFLLKILHPDVLIRYFIKLN
jgi:hypothetical protein